MLIKNKKIGQNFRENTKIRQKSNKKMVWPAWKNEKLEKFFLREKKFPAKFWYESFFPYPLVRLCYWSSPGLACKAGGAPDLSGPTFIQLYDSSGRL